MVDCYKPRVKRKLFEDVGNIQHHGSNPYLYNNNQQHSHHANSNGVNRSHRQIRYDDEVARWRRSSHHRYRRPSMQYAVIAAAADLSDSAEENDSVSQHDRGGLGGGGDNDWQSVADSQETYSEFDHNVSSSSSDSSVGCGLSAAAMSPVRRSGDSVMMLTKNDDSQQQHPDDLDGGVQPPPISSASTDGGQQSSGSNFKWLLNFKVESLFQTPWDQKSVKPSSSSCYKTPSSSVADGDDAMDRAADDAQSGSSFYPHHPMMPRGIRKPPYTYTELIELALRDEGELTVSGIYKWITEHFPFFKSADDRWKNSVRHNLSINANFKKGRKAQGSSHLWTIASETEKKNKQDLLSQANKNHWKKRKLDELEHTFELNGGSFLASNALLEENKENNVFYQPVHHCPKQVKQEPPSSPPPPPPSMSPPPPCNDSSTLTKSAEDILNGDVQKKVEVQMLTPLRPLAYAFLLESPEFLNPITQREVVQESGLLAEGGCGGGGGVCGSTGAASHLVGVPQQVFHSMCAEMEPSSLFEDELALGYLNISP